MSATLSDGYEAERIATPLIEAHHGELSSLRLRWFFSDQKPPKNLSCKSYVAVTILTPLHRILSSHGSDQEEGDHVAFVVNLELWSLMNERERRAWIDHGLSHVLVEVADDGSERLARLDHPIAEFPEVIARNGLWNDGLAVAARVIQRLGAQAVG